MQAMTITQTGSVEQLKLQDMPKPSLGPLDMLIEVEASSVNPVDTKVREGLFAASREFPFIPGYDVCGTVVELGSNVSDSFAVGDQIIASPNLLRHGAHASYVCVDHRTAAKKPASMSVEEAAVMPLVGLTAWESLHTRAGIRNGETVLVQAGGGGVGHVAIQLAKAQGCTVLTTASRDESIELCKQCGADHVINYTEEDVVEAVKRITNGAGCAVVFDTVGGSIFEQTMDCVAINGRVSAIVYTKTDQIFDKLFRRNATLHLEFMGVPPIYGINPQCQGETLSKMGALVEAGQLKMHISKTISLEQIPEAHEQLQGGHTTGKIAVRVK